MEHIFKDGDFIENDVARRNKKKSLHLGTFNNW